MDNSQPKSRPPNITRPQSWRVCNGNGLENNNRKFTRSWSINPPSPAPQFGCKGHLLEDGEGGVCVHNHVQVDPAEHFLAWTKPAVSVLVIKKICDKHATECFKELTRWLIMERNMEVNVEDSVLTEPALLEDEEFRPIRSQFCLKKDGTEVDDKIDLVICLGGDGTLLHVSTLFQRSCPPVMAFHAGSLGFLTPFKFENFRNEIALVLDANPRLTLRSRLNCEIIRKIGNSQNEVEEKRLVLNEVVIDRGLSPFLTSLDVYINGNYVTSVQGDGLIISTPTGSTAYAVAAGASMVHPNIPAILLTPVCPHSLSFRPIMVPAGVELEVMVNSEGRSNAWASFDGRNRHELQQGESLRVTTSIYPIPSINSSNQITDWFNSLAECLHWNVRQRQKSLNQS